MEEKPKAIFSFSFNIRLLDLVTTRRVKVGVKPLFIKFIFLFFFTVSRKRAVVHGHDIILVSSHRS